MSVLRLSTPQAALWIPIKLFSEILGLVAGSYRFVGVCLGSVGSIFGIVWGVGLVVLFKIDSSKYKVDTAIDRSFMGP
jgi:hypothetical protein